MKLPISARLLACCDYIAPGDRVADIGCDHGYLGIYLLLNGISPHTIEADIRPGPLSAAVKNGEKYGVEDNMTFCLSNGAQDIPKNFDTLVCAGMGADVMVSILSSAPWLQSDRYRLVLQCQSKTPILRKYLSETGWRIRGTVPLHRHGLCLGAGTGPDPWAVLPLPRPLGKRLSPAAGIHRPGPGPSGPQCPESGSRGGSL